MWALCIPFGLALFLIGYALGARDKASKLCSECGAKLRTIAQENNPWPVIDQTGTYTHLSQRDCDCSFCQRERP